MKSTIIVPLLALLALATTSAQAAPGRSGQMIVELNDDTDWETAIGELEKILSSAGMQDVRSRVSRVGVGSGFRALTISDAGKDLRAKIQAAAPIRRVEPELEWKLFDTQQSAPPGLDRLDSRRGLDGSYTFPANAGSGVDVYVIDSGCDTRHPDIAGRATFLTDFSGENSARDSNGHGSHVTGTILGRRFGVAKNAQAFCIKVFDASGRGSSVTTLRALELVSRQVASRPGRKSVVNMSLGGPKSFGGDTSTARAIRSLTQQGVAVVVAAGNESQDACNVSPAFIPEAITVGAIDPRNDAIASFSNFGSCVDLFAPGVNIESIRANSQGSTVLSGTSMASPHVAGAVAVLLSQGQTPQQARTTLINNATPNVVRGNIRGSPNRLLFLGASAQQQQRSQRF
ncbi:peptidase S8/S53 domain-containing protein [Catenaria anguillulae PL171]|uniref:Peptidase S8/S53 domain-containing protein n=1 Tax=Catenaria anguillulae PL171 TaxID=765915 RepID=A0A1Y2HGV5_9FUNG|nr:peptidase S8/S53 domain-containing protein [Catenaria anguillulae PL171]